MNNLVRRIYITTLKHGDKWKIVDKHGNNLYIQHYAKDVFRSGKYIAIGLPNTLRPKDGE